MRSSALKSNRGIGDKSIDKIMAADAAGGIRTNAQPRALIRTRQVNSLRKVEFELRLYRNEAA